MRRRRLIASCALPLLVGGACANKDPEPEDKEATPAAADENDASNDVIPAEADPAADTPAHGLGATAAAVIHDAAAAAAGAPLLEHENIIGHFMVANAEAFVKEIKLQVAPAQYASMVDLGVMQSMASSSIPGGNGLILAKLDFKQPFGCALVDSNAADAPVACVVGYDGGPTGLIADIREGKKDDAQGHLAAVSLEGTEVFIDAIGDQVVISNETDAFATAKSYLEANIVGRAERSIADVELIVYPDAARARYAHELEDVTRALDELTEKSPSGASDFNARIDELEQITFGLGLEPSGAYFAAAMHAEVGSELAKQVDQAYGGQMERDFVSTLPMSTFLFLGMQSGVGITEGDTWKDAIEAATKEVAEEFGTTPAQLQEAIEAFVHEESTLYTRDMAAGMMSEPGSLGAVVFEVGKKAPGREKWKAWTERFTTDAILPEKAAKEIQWSFEAGATTIEGVEIDRWSLGLTPKALKEAGTDEDAERIRKMWPDLTLRIDRAELDDRVIFVLAPTEIDTYMKSAIEATRGGLTIRDHQGWTELPLDEPATTALYALDIAGGIAWLRPLLPPEDAADIPSDLGGGIDDVSLVLQHPAPGVIAGSFNLSQAMIDQTKAIAAE